MEKGRGKWDKRDIQYYHEQLNGNVSEIYHSGFVPKLVLMKNNLYV